MDTAIDFQDMKWRKKGFIIIAILYVETPPDDVFYDFACELQEYCPNRVSGCYKDT